MVNKALKAMKKWSKMMILPFKVIVSRRCQPSKDGRAIGQSNKSTKLMTTYSNSRTYGLRKLRSKRLNRLNSVKQLNIRISSMSSSNFKHEIIDFKLI